MEARETLAETEADEFDAVAGAAYQPDFWDKVRQANKAIIAAVGSIAALAIMVGVGDAALWAQITAVIVAILTVVGVFAVANDPPL